MTDELDGGGHNATGRNGKEGRLGVHRNLLLEFAIKSSREDVVDTFLASPVESMLYAVLGCAIEHVQGR